MPAEEVATRLPAPRRPRLLRPTPCRRRAERDTRTTARRDARRGAARAQHHQLRRDSRLLKELENQLQLPLIRRNTHGISTTEAGISLAKDARAILNAWDDLVSRHGASHSGGAGLQIALPSDLGPNSLPDVIIDHVAAAPDRLRVRWRVADDEISFFRSGCDPWVRAGEVRDHGLIVTTVGYVRSIVVISPSHPAARTVSSPIDLVRLDAVGAQPCARREGRVRLRSASLKKFVDSLRLRVPRIDGVDPS